MYLLVIYSNGLFWVSSGESARLPPMWPRFDSGPVPHVGWVCCLFSPRFEDFSPGTSVFPSPQKPTFLKFQFDLDYCQALYHEPLARVIAQALPVFDIKLACTFFLHLRDFGCHPGDRELYSLNRVSHHSQILVVDWEPEQMFHPCSSSTIPSWCPMFDEWKIREISPKQYTLQYIWVIDQARGQDSWILAKFLFACLWNKAESRSIYKHAKMNEVNIQPSWPNKLGK